MLTGPTSSECSRICKIAPTASSKLIQLNRSLPLPKTAPRPHLKGNKTWANKPPLRLKIGLKRRKTTLIPFLIDKSHAFSQAIQRVAKNPFGDIFASEMNDKI